MKLLIFAVALFGFATLVSSAPLNYEPVELFYFEDGTILDRAARAEHLGRSLEFAEVLGRRFHNNMITTGYFHKQVVSHLVIPTLTRLHKERLNVIAGCLDGDFDLVKKHLPAAKGINWHMYEDMVSPLDAAVYKGDANLNMVKFLIEQAGADMNFKNGYGESALYIAAAMNHRKIAHYLIEKGVNTNDTNRDGISVAMVATYLGHPEILRDLLQHWASIEPIIGDRDFVHILIEKPLNTCANGEKIWQLLSQYGKGWRLTDKQRTQWKFNNECE